jgi:hypothetical protein
MKPGFHELFGQKATNRSVTTCSCLYDREGKTSFVLKFLAFFSVSWISDFYVALKQYSAKWDNHLSVDFNKN